MNFNIEDCRTNFKIAEEKYEASLEKDEEEKEKLKQEKYEALDKTTQELLKEYDTTHIGGFGGGLRFFLFLVFIGISIALWFTRLKETELDFLPFILISAVISLIASIILVFIFNKNSRKRQKRLLAIKQNPVISDYLKFCNDIDDFTSEETSKALEEYIDATDQLYKATNIDTVLIYAPSSRTDDNITFRKSITLHIDGMIYSENLRSGVTKIKLNPGYHTFRFEEDERPINQSGLTASFREGYYGGANTTAEFSCQINTSNRMPAGIVLHKKDRYLIFEDMTLDQYREYFFNK